MRKMTYLTTEHMITILQQRVLELEADIYRQRVERELGEQHELPGLVTAANTKIEIFEIWIADLEKKIERLEHPLIQVEADIPE